MRTHNYSSLDLCNDCCIPRYMANEHKEFACPYTSAEVSKYISAWYPLFEAGEEKLRSIADAVIGRMVDDYFGG